MLSASVDRQDLQAFVRPGHFADHLGSPLTVYRGGLHSLMNRSVFVTACSRDTLLRGERLTEVDSCRAR
jgi:hypothetical protein